jgi:Zn finger protein HypA/HybF involved in hydrogenase expression
MQSCARFLAELLKLHGVTASAGLVFPRESVRDPAACKYCSSLVIITADKTTCPNCGAPAS